jgi:glycosyltransferase involved in cell wall biosynthesis
LVEEYDRFREGPTLLFIVNVAWFFVSHRLALARAAQRAGFRVHLASDVESDAEEAAVREAGIAFHRVRIARSGWNLRGELTTLHDLRRTVRLVSPDLIHNVTAKPVIHGSRVARRLHTPAIVNAVSGFGYVYSGGKGRRILRALLDRAYAQAFKPLNVRVIVQNDVDREEVVRICPAAQERVRVIRGSGVDLREFRPSPEPAGTPIVVLPARLLREKGVLEFAAAAAELRNAGVSARFVIAGRLDPENRGALTGDEVQDLCVRSGVEWIGDCRDMPSLFRNSHLVCLPSYREGMPKVLLEACAAGRAVITSDCPGCRDVVPSGQNGILVPPRDSRALAAAMRELLLDPLRRQEMGRESRLLAERAFGIDRVVQEHLQIYRQLLESSSRAAAL